MSGSAADFNPKSAPIPTPCAQPKMSSALDRPIMRGEEAYKVSFSAFTFLFSEICMRAKDAPRRVQDVLEWEERIASLGRQVGMKCAEVCVIKEPQVKQRQLTIQSMLELIRTSFWYRWFGKHARLDAIVDQDNFIIVDDDPVPTRYIYMPKDYMENNVPTLNFAAFVGGMIEGILASAGFGAKVIVYSVPTAEHPKATQFLVQVQQYVVERERRNRR